LKSEPYENFGKIKRKNTRKYLQIWDDQIKQLIEARSKENIPKEIAKFKLTN
jgi:hypothetical protein